MTDRVFEDDRSFDVSDQYRDLEVYVFDFGSVMISVTEDIRANFTMTAEEATLLKEFLIRKGY